MRFVSLMDLRAPAAVLDIDVSKNGEGAKAAPLGVTRYEGVWCLLRWGDWPLGVVYGDVSADAQLTIDELVDETGDVMALSRAQRDAFEVPDSSEGRDAPSLTVVICTRNRPLGLKNVLRSLTTQRDPNFSVIVVENGDDPATTTGIVNEIGLPDCRCIVETEPGLSRARNRGLAAVQTELVAWLDDDEIADRSWTAQIRRGFAHEAAPVAVCGLMCPAELEYDVQVQFEQYGGFNKGRGVLPEVLRKGTPTVVDPLYPLPTFGAGGNMAFRTCVLREVGGFDPCLGAGTRTCGGEETLVLSRLLAEGLAVLHWPVAITWHTHRRDVVGFRKQMYGCGAGLSAFYTSVVLHDPRKALKLVGLAPHVVHDMKGGADNRRVGNISTDYPKDLLRARRRGYVEGGFMYIYEVARAWVVRRSRTVLNRGAGLEAGEE
jgi:glycosyltransferase involved in cell wall biosynthesis